MLPVYTWSSSQTLIDAAKYAQTSASPIAAARSPEGTLVGTAHRCARPGVLPDHAQHPGVIAA